MSAEVAEELALRGHAGTTPTHHSAMEAIDRGATDASALSRALGISRQAAAKTIHSLEQLGYIERGIDAGDARRRPLKVTQRGRERIRLGAAAYEQILLRLEARVGAATVAELERLLHLIPEITQAPGQRTHP
jgi:DNA-binding MarR family transcriptional regulator